MFFNIFISFVEENPANIMGVILVGGILIVGILEILKIILKSIHYDISKNNPYSDWSNFFVIFLNIIFYGGLLGYFMNEGISGDDLFLWLFFILLITIEMISFITKFLIVRDVIMNKNVFKYIASYNEKINLFDLLITILVIIFVFSVSYFYYKNNIFITISLCLLLNNRMSSILKLFKNFFLKNIYRKISN